MFTPFTGVGPHRFIDLFSMQSAKWYSRNRKDKEGKVIKLERDAANSRNPMSLYNYIEMEMAALKQYTEEINGIRKEETNGQNSESDARSK